MQEQELILFFRTVINSHIPYNGKFQIHSVPFFIDSVISHGQTSTALLYI